MEVLIGAGWLAVGAGTLALGYSIVLAVASLGRGVTHGEVPGPGRVAVLIPAQNEEAGLGLLLRDLGNQTKAPVAILVVDHASGDGTARVAASKGAIVLSIPGGGGKSAALTAGLEHLQSASWDSVLVLDADCRIPREFISGCRAGTGEVVQVRIRMRAFSDGRGLLYEFASRLEETFLHVGRSRFGFPAFLRGTGMLLGRDALARCPWRGSGLTEDREQGFRFLRQGIPIRFETAIEVQTPPPSRIRDVWNQRRRWISSGLPLMLFGAFKVAWAARAWLGLRGLELPLAVLADARSQWMLLVAAGTACLAVAGSEWVWGVAVLLLAAGVWMGTGFAWYGRRFLRALFELPGGALIAAAAAALAAAGRGPGAWRRGRGNR